MECLAARRSLQLRLGLARNNQRKGINWAEEFAFERLRLGLPGAVAQLGERQSGTLEVRGSIPLGSITSSGASDRAAPGTLVENTEGEMRVSIGGDRRLVGAGLR
jgi:hypothetical protein